MVKRTLLFLFCFTALSTIGLSQQVITDGTVNFKIRNLGLNVDGSFSNSKIESDLSGSDISQWKIQGEVGVSTINTDNEKRDGHLLEEDYFDVQKHPKIMLNTAGFEKTDEGDLYYVTVDLTIKGTTKTMTIPIRISQQGTIQKVSSEFEINRRDFGVGGSSFVMSNTVKISVNYKAKLP